MLSYAGVAAVADYIAARGPRTHADAFALWTVARVCIKMNLTCEWWGYQLCHELVYAHTTKICPSLVRHEP